VPITEGDCLANFVIFPENPRLKTHGLDDPSPRAKTGNSVIFSRLEFTVHDPVAVKGPKLPIVGQRI
jgi:hypothetical protein